MINLLYPEGYEPSEKIISDKTIESLELKYIAMLICPYNTDFALKVLTELVTDKSVIEWRQDILEDFINIPQLEILLYNSIHTIYEGSLSVFAKSGSTQSFFELNDNISQMEAFVECMEKCHSFVLQYSEKIKSAGIKAILEMTEIPDKINPCNPDSRLGTLTAECDESGNPTYRIASGKPDFSRNAKYIFEKYGISFEQYKRTDNTTCL